MNTTLWMICGIAVFTLLLGIVSTIIVKMEAVPNWRKIVIVLYWIIGLLLFKVVVWGIYKHSKEVSFSPSPNTTCSGMPIVQPKEEWILTWELPPEQYVRGLNKSKPLVAEIIKRDDSNLWVNVVYIQYDKTEVARMRLSKVRDKFWEGIWEQDSPKDFGRCDLHEVSLNVLAGHMTGVSNVPAFCTLKRK